MMSHATNRNGKSQTLRYLVALLCVLLILFVGLAQTLHVHAPDEAANANASCSLCAVAHVNALPAPVLASLAIGESVMPVGPPELLAAPQRYFASSLYVRPPPALTSHS